MKGKTIVLGVTGSIAAYKSAELLSLLIKKGASVHTVMTNAATKFIAPLTLRTISGNPVWYDMFQDFETPDVIHISLARKADILVIAPASANCLGKAASGIADDLLTTMIMAMQVPVLFVPAMNEAMYENPILKKNIGSLKAFGYNVMEPDFGYLACGREGKGRLPNPKAIVCEIDRILSRRASLKGVTILVTAGPTQEPLDPVRYITNRSSGKMGYELAKAAQKRGADVILVTGPAALAPPPAIKVINVRTTNEMFHAVMEHLDATDVIIGAAAPADWRPSQVAPEKIKKNGGLDNIELVKCEDIMKEIGIHKGNRITIGFAAETCNLIENSRYKLISKNLDFIVANDVSRNDAGFESDYNEVKILHRHGLTENLPYMTKREVADEILDRVLPLLRTSQSTGL